jgi:VWFA-related protein
MPSVRAYPPGAGCRSLRIWLLAIPLGLAVLPIAGQAPAGRAPDRTDQESPSTPRPPTFRVEANFVRVDAFPTKDGHPVADLTAADFEVLEDGAPQRIETFEHVMVRGRAPQESRREPNSISEGRSMAADPRSRVFVIFLDTYHTPIAGSYRMQRVLANMLDRLIGPDDLFAVMTPRMSSADITFARRTMTLERELAKYWYWGQRDNRMREDAEDRNLRDCGMMVGGNDSDAAMRELVARRHEKLALDALADLAIYLRGVREERKAVIAITSGWVLYEPNRSLMEPPDNRPPIGQVGVGPDGRITSDTDKAHGGSFSRRDCDTLRMQLASLDLRDEFRTLLDVANRSNVSFYPFDSRGLAAADDFSMDGRDDGIEPGQRQILERQRGGEVVGHYTPLNVDQGMLRQRLDVLQTLAVDTDGLAIVDSNDLDKGARRIVDDLSSYYLLGYYSRNTKLDGKFRSIKVRVKRPGVHMRARRGYRAATEEEMRHARSSQAAITTAPSVAVANALAALTVPRTDVPMLTRVSWVPASRDQTPPDGQAWVAAEIDGAVARSREWVSGGDVQATLVSIAAGTIAEAQQEVPAGESAFVVRLPNCALVPGEYLIRVRVTPKTSQAPLVDTIRFAVPTEATAEPELFRKGPTTGVQYVVTADPRFRRTERIRVNAPLARPATGATSELLDRTGKLLAVPVSATVRPDADGRVWATADLTLAPLAPGDYAIRITVQGTPPAEIVTAFRLVP